MKLHWADLSKRIARLAVEVVGPRSLALTDDDDGRWVDRYLASFANSIGGGTSEIQRNIIGERVLGLPR
jgi:alkylation response protein AidB-like acyl-CoA dehydrogenase